MFKISDETIEIIADGIVDLIRQGRLLKKDTEGDGGLQGKENLEVLWYNYIKRVDPHEKKYIVIINSLLTKQAKEVFDKIKRYPNDYKKWMFDKKKWLKEFTEAEAKFIVKLYKQEGQKAIDLALKLSRKSYYKAEEEIPISIAFDVYNPEVTDELIKQTTRFPAGVVGTSEEIIRREIANGLELGESIDKLRKRVTGRLGPTYIKNRAEMIARSETIYASNAGAELGYMQSGVVEGKKWLTAIDERTCDPCTDMNNMTAPIGQPTWEKKGLDVGAVQSKYDLDFSYTEGEMPFPPLHPRCRCTIIPILERYEVQTPQLDRINEFEAGHGGEYTETAYAVDDTGKVIIEKEGGRGFVEFRPHEYEEITSTKNVIFTHSHPGNCSFSGGDFSWLADMHPTSEMRIAAKNYNYSVKMTKKTVMPKSRGEIVRIHNEIGKRYHEQFKNMYNGKVDFFRDAGMKVADAKEAASEAISELHIKAVNKDFVKMFNLKFKRTKRIL